jgi:hypothetical protein
VNLTWMNCSPPHSYSCCTPYCLVDHLEVQVTSLGWVSPERQAPYYTAMHLLKPKKIKCLRNRGKTRGTRGKLLEHFEGRISKRIYINHDSGESRSHQYPALLTTCSHNNQYTFSPLVIKVWAPRGICDIIFDFLLQV